MIMTITVVIIDNNNDNTEGVFGVKSLSLCVVVHQSRYSCKQCTDAYPNSRTTPKTQTRSRSYTRSLTSSQVTEKAMFCWDGFKLFIFYAAAFSSSPSVIPSYSSAKP